MGLSAEAAARATTPSDAPGTSPGVIPLEKMLPLEPNKYGYPGELKPAST